MKEPASVHVSHVVAVELVWEFGEGPGFEWGTDKWTVRRAAVDLYSNGDDSHVTWVTAHVVPVLVAGEMYGGGPASRFEAEELPLPLRARLVEAAAKARRRKSLEGI